MTATRIRGSSAAASIVIRPPYESPTQPIRRGSTAGWRRQEVERPEDVAEVLGDQEPAEELHADEGAVQGSPLRRSARRPACGGRRGSGRGRRPRSRGGRAGGRSRSGCWRPRCAELGRVAAADDRVVAELAVAVDRQERGPPVGAPPPCRVRGRSRWNGNGSTPSAVRSRSSRTWSSSVTIRSSTESHVAGGRWGRAARGACRRTPTASAGPRRPSSPGTASRAGPGRQPDPLVDRHHLGPLGAAGRRPAGRPRQGGEREPQDVAAAHPRARVRVHGPPPRSARLAPDGPGVAEWIRIRPWRGYLSRPGLRRGAAPGTFRFPPDRRGLREPGS